MSGCNPIPKGVGVRFTCSSPWKSKQMGDCTRFEPGRASRPWEFDSPLFRHGWASRLVTAPGLNPGEPNGLGGSTPSPSATERWQRGNATGCYPVTPQGVGGSIPSRSAMAL
jgi:hypothetical protein